MINYKNFAKKSSHLAISMADILRILHVLLIQGNDAPAHPFSLNFKLQVLMWFAHQRT